MLSLSKQSEVMLTVLMSEWDHPDWTTLVLRQKLVLNIMTVVCGECRQVCPPNIVAEHKLGYQWLSHADDSEVLLVPCVPLVLASSVLGGDVVRLLPSDRIVTFTTPFCLHISNQGRNFL